MNQWDDIIHAHESSNYTRALKEGATTWIKGRCVKLSRDQRPVQWQGQVVIQVEGRDIVTDDDVVATYPLGKVFKKLFPIYATFQVVCSNAVRNTSKFVSDSLQGSELRDDRTGERLEEFPMRCSGQRRMHVEPRTRDVDMIRRGTRRVRPGCDENFGK